MQGFRTGASFAQSGLGLSAETGPRTVIVEPIPETIIGTAHSDAVPTAKTRLLASTILWTICKGQSNPSHTFTETLTLEGGQVPTYL